MVIIALSYFAESDLPLVFLGGQVRAVILLMDCLLRQVGTKV